MVCSPAYGQVTKACVVQYRPKDTKDGNSMAIYEYLLMFKKSNFRSPNRKFLQVGLPTGEERG